MTALTGRMNKMTCLRFIPDRREEGMILFEKRNAIYERIGEVTEMMIEAAKAGDLIAYKNHADKVAALNIEADALSMQMRPLQYVAWEKEKENLVTDAGINHILDTFWRGSGYTQTIVMGLKGTGSVAAGDTQASHSGWSEVGGSNNPTYTGNRKAVTMGAASSKVSTSPQQTFAITSTGTVAGMFMNNGGSSTKDNTTGTLVSAVDFTGGNEAVDNGDSLLVTYTFTGADT